MAGFASNVKSILDIYSNCLVLLKSLKKKSASDKASGRLRRSIRSDQAKIQNAYANGLSRRGKSFSEGDGNKFHFARPATSLFYHVECNPCSEGRVPRLD